MYADICEVDKIFTTYVGWKTKHDVRIVYLQAKQDNNNVLDLDYNS